MPLLFVCPCVNQDLIIQIHKLMEIKNNKELYKSPQIAVLELMEEGVICTSGLKNGQLDDPDDYLPEDDPFQF